MRIGGLNKTSLIDYPGKVSAVLFTQGCNFRCPFCHNPELVYPEKFVEPIPDTEIFQFLDKRKNQLDGVVISGGEPTIHSDLVVWVQKIKALGFLVKLDTNGSDPHTVKALLKDQLIDFIAMDIKAPFNKYHQLAGVDISIKSIQESISIIETSNIDYEFRTTQYKKLLTDKDIDTIAKTIKKPTRYRVQEYIQPKK